MTHSMTGFARCEQKFPWGQLSCEIRSVNHRYLEPSFRLPDALRTTESKLRDLIKTALSRGKIDVAIFVRQEQDASGHINPQALKTLVQLTTALSEQLPACTPVNPLEVLRWPGIVQTQELDAQELADAAYALTQQTLVQLQNSRAREGQSLAEHIQARLTEMRQHLSILRTQLPQLITAQQNKSNKKLPSFI